MTRTTCLAPQVPVMPRPQVVIVTPVSGGEHSSLPEVSSGLGLPVTFYKSSADLPPFGRELMRVTSCSTNTAGLASL